MRNLTQLVLAMVMVTMTIDGGPLTGRGSEVHAMQTIQLTEANKGQVVHIQLADQVRITLPSNPSTGFLWENVSAQDSIMIQDGQPLYLAHPVSKGLVGGGGTHTFCFKAVATGRGEIKLIYRRPWAKQEAVDLFQVTVIVS